ncbi:MAG: phosphate ABC transporter substrate-binding protein [Solirubrobacterales bacterium]
MKKTSLKLVLAALAVTVMAGAFAGCSSKTTTDTSGVSGSITLAGSTALQPLAEQAGKKFTEKNTKAIINVQGGGSGTGLKLVSEGTADIGNSDVAAEVSLGKDKAAELVDHKVCALGFALVVNKDVKVTNLTKQQAQDIFSGKITNWKEVGGDDMKIEVIHRAKSSGTRATFKEKVMGGVDENDSIGTMQDSNGNVEKAIASTKGSISYLALSYLTDEVKKNVTPIQIDGADANKANIAAGKYTFWSYEYMYTKGEAKGLTKAFIDYMASDANKSLIESLGYIPSSDIK